MALQPLEVHSFADLDHTYRAFPRQGWKGKAMIYLMGKSAVLVSHGSRIRLTAVPRDIRDGGHGAEVFDVTVVEMPSVRPPLGVQSVAIVDRQPGMRFLDDGTMPIESAELLTDEHE